MEKKIHYITPNIPLFAFNGYQDIVGIQEMQYVDDKLSKVLLYYDAMTPFSHLDYSELCEIDTDYGMFCCSYNNEYGDICLNGETLATIARGYLINPTTEMVAEVVSDFKRHLSIMHVPHFNTEQEAIDYVRGVPRC